MSANPTTGRLVSVDADAYNQLVEDRNRLASTIRKLQQASSGALKEFAQLRQSQTELEKHCGTLEKRNAELEADLKRTHGQLKQSEFLLGEVCRVSKEAVREFDELKGRYDEEHRRRLIAEGVEHGLVENTQLKRQQNLTVADAADRPVKQPRSPTKRGQGELPQPRSPTKRGQGELPQPRSPTKRGQGELPQPRSPTKTKRDQQVDIQEPLPNGIQTRSRQRLAPPVPSNDAKEVPSTLLRQWPPVEDKSLLAVSTKPLPTRPGSKQLPQLPTATLTTSWIRPISMETETSTGYNVLSVTDHGRDVDSIYGAYADSVSPSAEVRAGMTAMNVSAVDPHSSRAMESRASTMVDSTLADPRASTMALKAHSTTPSATSSLNSGARPTSTKLSSVSGKPASVRLTDLVQQGDNFRASIIGNSIAPPQPLALAVNNVVHPKATAISQDNGMAESNLSNTIVELDHIAGALNRAQQPKPLAPKQHTVASPPPILGPKPKSSKNTSATLPSVPQITPPSPPHIANKSIHEQIEALRKGNAINNGKAGDRSSILFLHELVTEIEAGGNGSDKYDDGDGDDDAEW